MTRVVIVVYWRGEYHRVLGDTCVQRRLFQSQVSVAKTALEQLHIHGDVIEARRDGEAVYALVKAASIPANLNLYPVAAMKDSTSMVCQLVEEFELVLE